MAWSPDSRTIAAYGGCNQVTLYDVKSASCVATVDIVGNVNFLVWSPDGKTLVTALLHDKVAKNMEYSDDSSVKVIDVRSRACETTLDEYRCHNVPSVLSTLPYTAFTCVYMYVHVDICTYIYTYIRI